MMLCQEAQDKYSSLTSPDLISTSEVYVSMAIEDVMDRKMLARLVRELEKIGIVRAFFVDLTL